MAWTETKSGFPVWTVEDWSDQTSQSEKQLWYCGEVSWTDYRPDETRSKPPPCPGYPGEGRGRRRTARELLSPVPARAETATVPPVSSVSSRETNSSFSGNIQTPEERKNRGKISLLLINYFSPLRRLVNLIFHGKSRDSVQIKSSLFQPTES